MQYVICFHPQEYHCHFFRIFAPSKPPPMNRHRTYCQMNPLTGIWPAYGDALGYRYASPNGDEGRNNQYPSARHVSASSPPRCDGATTTLHSPLSTLNSSHTLSAKERDSETGLSYFGARYYSSDLSIWLSVDPMSDKYLSLSPYVYCADNPVKLVDPNGEELTSPDGWVVDNTNKTLIWVNDMGGDMCQYVGGMVTSFKSRSDFINEYASNGYKINLENYSKPLLNTGSSSIQAPPPLSTNDYSKSFFGAVSDAYSGSAKGWNCLSNPQQQKLSYNLTKSLKNNGYSIQTRQVKGGIKSFYSTNVTRGMYAFNITMDIADFTYSYKVLDGGRFGVNSYSSLGSSVGGWGSALIGMKLGVSLGASAGPYGSIVGGVIGGVAFGFWGSEVGSKIGIDTYNSINKKKY